MSCAWGTNVKPQTNSRTYSLAQPSAVDKPGKASVAQIRETANNVMKRKAEAGGFKDRGDIKEGLYPGDSGIFRMADDTLAFKHNLDGKIIKKPVCGHWFTEQDGSYTVYEWGKIVDRDENC